MFANGYVSLFIIPYGGKAGSGLNPLRDFVKIDIWRWEHGRPDEVCAFNVLTSYADLSLTFMYSFQAVTSHPTVTDVNITCVTVAYGDYMTAHCMIYVYMTVMAQALSY